MLFAVRFGNACAIEADIVFGAFAAESALCAHVGNADHVVSAVSVFAAFDIVFAFVHGVADAAVTAFSVAEAFRASDACAIQADLAFVAVAIDCAGTGHQAGAIDTEAAFALRAEHAFDFFRGVADFGLTGDATAFGAEHVIGTVGVCGTFGFRARFAKTVVADIAIEAVRVNFAAENNDVFAFAGVADAFSATVRICVAFRCCDGFAFAIEANIAIFAIGITIAFGARDDRIAVARIRGNDWIAGFDGIRRGFVT